MKRSKKRKKSNTWKIKQHRDQFFKKSKTLGYRSRAAFKLIELNKKFNFLKKNSNLLDIGAYPGGWSQVARQKIDIGKMMAIDLEQMEEINKEHGGTLGRENFEKLLNFCCNFFLR